MGTRRTHVLLPEDLIREIDELLGPRGRSAFVVELLLWIPPAMKSAAKGFCSYCKTRKLCGRTKIIPSWRRALRLGYGGRELKMKRPDRESAGTARKCESCSTLPFSSTFFVYATAGVS